VDAGALVADVILAYRHAKVYRDVGTVTHHGHLETHQLRFETRFERPDRFEFAFSYPDRPPVDGFWVRSVGEVIAVSDSLPQDLCRSLDLALAGMTGISLGAAATVPRLLMPARISSRLLFGLADDHVLGASETIDGEAHDVIEMRDRSTLWRVVVARETKAIRRIEQRFGERLESVHEYDAVLTP
jgi:hypothetical protein